MNLLALIFLSCVEPDIALGQVPCNVRVYGEMEGVSFDYFNKCRSFNNN